MATYDHAWWISQLDKDEKRLKDGWWTLADKIVKKYKGKNADDADRPSATFPLNIFWSNVGVLKAALYGKQPRPLVNRIWADMEDDVARVAALMLERALSYDLMKNKSPMDKAIRLAVEDWLIPGLGQIWMRYDPTIEIVKVPGTPIEIENITDEKVACDYVHWRDFVFPAARTADELWYMGRKIYLTAKEFKSRFKVTVPKSDEKTPINDQDGVMPKNFTEGKICLYELWCKKNRRVYWVSREIPDFCEKKDDFLGLEDFYPCPMPLMATHTTDDYLPRSDYTMMKSQYDELNELNTRVTILERALRVVGVYDKKNAEVSRVLTEARENEMIPVDKWAVLAEAGGMKGVVDWFPMEMISNVLDKLREQKAEKKQEIYELSGISDIMRGASNPRETLGAQKMKAEYGSVRLQFRQDEIAQFVKSALAIKAEIMCEHFQDQTLVKLSNMDMTPDRDLIPQAIQLLRDTKLTLYRVDINEQNLALPDYQQEQENRMELLTTVGQFMSQSAQMVQSAPGALPHMLQMVRWVASGFRGSNEIQGVMDAAIKAAEQNPAQGEQEQPVPEDKSPEVEQIKQQGEMQRVEMELKNRMDIEQGKATMEGQRQLTEGQQRLKEIQLAKDLELRNKIREIQAKAEADIVAAEQEAEQEAACQDIEHEHDIENAEISHQNSLEQGEQSGDVQLEVSKLRKPAGNTPRD